MIKTLTATIGAILLAGCATAETAPSTYPLGWLEHVRVTEVDLELDAKLDTGAKTSSIHAEILSAPKRQDFVTNEPQPIVFRLTNEDGESREMQANISRWAAIKTKKGGLLYRPVVKMTFCLGGREISGEVTLANRSHFNYETLIGRNMLKEGEILVDPARIYTKRARCSTPS